MQLRQNMFWKKQELVQNDSGMLYQAKMNINEHYSSLDQAQVTT